MKKIFLAVLFFSNIAWSEETKPSQPQPATDTSKKMTTKDAKKTCKEEGKTGPDLVKCMKEKKEEK